MFTFLLVSIRRNKNGKGPANMLGSVYTRFDHMWYCWELVVLLLKFLLGISLFLFASVSKINTLRQAVYALIILLAQLTFHNYAAPYDNWVLNQYQTVCYMCLFMQVFCGLCFSGDVSTDFSAKMSMLVRFFIITPWVLLFLAKFDTVADVAYEVYLKNIKEKKDDKKSAQTQEQVKKLSLAMQLKLANVNKGGNVHRHAEFFLTDHGVRITQELWYEAQHDPTIMVPSKHEMNPLFDALYDAIDDSASMELETRELDEAFDNALKYRGMVMETLAQNKVADNLEIKEVIERVLMHRPSLSLTETVRRTLKALRKRFDMERERAGSTYTQHLAAERKAAKANSRAKKKKEMEKSPSMSQVAASGSGSRI